MDLFVIYNDIGYQGTRTAVSNAAYGKQLPALVESCKVLSIKSFGDCRVSVMMIDFQTQTMNVQETVPLLLAMYQKVTLSHSSNQPSKRIFPDVMTVLIVLR